MQIGIFTTRKDAILSVPTYIYIHFYKPQLLFNSNKSKIHKRSTYLAGKIKDSNDTCWLRLSAIFVSTVGERKEIDAVLFIDELSSLFNVLAKVVSRSKQ